jgi:hypothetical protein
MSGVGELITSNLIELSRASPCPLACSKVLADSEAEFDRCNGTPAFLAPEMMRPNARYRCGTGAAKGWVSVPANGDLGRATPPSPTPPHPIHISR